MDVIIMQSTTSILANLKNKYPQFKFQSSDKFAWSPTEKIIYYNKASENLPILLIHELSHALLDHNQYNRDIELIALEREAWDHTKLIAPSYKINVDETIVQSNMDSYRDWLHARSTCPRCIATGIQNKDNAYNCSVCNNTWLANEAKNRSLRRYQTKKRT
jgi:hypothetical protein